MSTQTAPVVDTEKQALLDRIAQLEAKIEKKGKLADALKIKTGKEGKQTISIIVSDKGGISFYGFGRFPLTMYANVLLFVLDHATELRAFLASHASELSSK